MRLVERWPHGNQALDAASEACKDMCKDMHDSASSRNWPLARTWDCRRNLNSASPERSGAGEPPHGPPFPPGGPPWRPLGRVPDRSCSCSCHR